MLPCQCVWIIVHQMLKKCHRKLSAGSDNKKNHSTVHGCEMPFLEILAFLQKGGRGKKYFIFAIFFAEPIFV